MLPGKQEGVAFYNLGKDARLIAPRPMNRPLKQYSHLGMFVRDAQKEQIDAVLALVATEYLKQLRKSPSKPVWLSTSGLGVAWLHFRLDSSPKYYQYRPFARPGKKGYN